MKLLKALFLFLIFFGIIGFVFAMFWDIERPSHPTEKTIELKVSPTNSDTNTTP